MDNYIDLMDFNLVNIWQCSTASIWMVAEAVSWSGIEMSAPKQPE